VGQDRPQYKIEFDDFTVWCVDSRAAGDLIRELQEGRRPARAKRDHGQSGTAKQALLDGQYRTAISTLVAHHPDGMFGDELLGKVGFEDNTKGFGGFMTGLRNQLGKAGLPENAVIRERRKNGEGWKNHFRLDDRAAEILKKWLEG